MHHNKQDGRAEVTRKARLLTTIIVIGAALNVATAADLEESFFNPPDMARPWVYWTQSGEYAHQPNEDAPGATFGPYGVFWNRKQTFWPLVRDYHEYLAQCSYLLQQGVTVSDILYLTPEGVPQVFQPPASTLHSAGSRLPDKKGYSFDGCSPRILISRAEVRDGRIAFPGGTSYQLLVLPRWKTMTPALLEKIIQLVEGGAVVYGAPPVASPSLRDYPQCDVRVRELADKLWGKTDATQRQLGKGRVIWDPAAQAGNPAPPLLPGTGKWIWLNEGSPAQNAAAGNVYFRYTWDIPDTRLLRSAIIEATADNTVSLMANLWTNRLIGDASRPQQERFTRTAIRPPLDGGLRPSGLLGPVTFKTPGNARIINERME